MTDDNTDTSLDSSSDTVQFNVEIPRRLHEKWKKAVKKKHGKYRGASKEERLRMIESWADAILNDEETVGPEPTNRDVLDVVTRRFDEIEERLNESGSRSPPAPPFRESELENNNRAKNRDENFSSDGDTVDGTMSGSIGSVDTHARGHGGFSETELENNNSESEQPRIGRGFWDDYNPDETREEPLSKEVLKEVPDLRYPEINPEHIISDNLPGFKAVRASIVAAVIRYEHDEISFGDILGFSHDVLDNGRDYIKSEYVPLIAEEFVDHPRADNMYCASPEAYDRVCVQLGNRDEEEFGEFNSLVADVLVADSVDEIKDAVREIDDRWCGAMETQLPFGDQLVGELEEYAPELYGMWSDLESVSESNCELKVEMLGDLSSDLQRVDDEESVLSDRPSSMQDLLREYIDESDNSGKDDTDEDVDRDTNSINDGEDDDGMGDHADMLRAAEPTDESD